MWNGILNEPYSRPRRYAEAGSEDRFNSTDPYEWFDSFVQQPQGVEADLYVQSPLSVPWELHTPCLDRISQPLPYHIPNLIPTTAPGWQDQFRPQALTGITADTSPIAIEIDALVNGSMAVPSTNGHSPPPPFIPIPSPFSDSAPSSSAKKSITPGASLLTSAGIPSPSDLEEITHPPDKPPLSFCDFGSTLTLGDALKNFSLMTGEDGTRRAFPSRKVAAKLAFWLTFNFGDEFLPRRKQVTVVTTRKSIVEQPSKARLAHLVAREMERYLKECDLRRKPFPYGLDDIVLRGIDLTSKGTIRPRLYIYTRLPD